MFIGDVSPVVTSDGKPRKNGTKTEKRKNPERKPKNKKKRNKNRNEPEQNLEKPERKPEKPERKLEKPEKPKILAGAKFGAKQKSLFSIFPPRNGTQP